MGSEAPIADLLSHARTIDVRGVSMEMVVKGKGPPLLLLHGMDGVEGAAALIDALAQNYEVYAPSHPGFGASALPSGATTVDDIAYTYLDLLELLDLRDVVVAGFSFGGWLAAEILVKDCSRAARVVLGAPLGLRTGDRRTRRVADIFVLDEREKEARMQHTKAAPIAVAELSDTALERKMRNTEALSRFGWSPYLYNPKLAQRLHRINAPVLMLWGEEDQIAPIAYGKDYASSLAAASFEAIPQCGHRIYVDQPAAAAQHIHAFAQAKI